MTSTLKVGQFDGLGLISFGVWEFGVSWPQHTQLLSYFAELS